MPQELDMLDVKGTWRSESILDDGVREYGVAWEDLQEAMAHEPVIDSISPVLEWNSASGLQNHPKPSEYP